MWRRVPRHAVVEPAVIEHAATEHAAVEPRAGVGSTTGGRARARLLWLSVGVLAAGGLVLLLGCFTRSGATSSAALARLQRSGRDVDSWLARDRFGAPLSKPSQADATALVAARLDAWAYTKTDPRSKRLGSVRAGRVLWGSAEASKRGCAGGWYALEQGGHACASGSFRLLDEAGAPRESSAAPALDAALPYAYVRVATQGAPRYRRLPAPDEEAAARAGRDGSPLERRMIGDYFLAVAGEQHAEGRRFYRTLRDQFVRADDVAPTAPSSLHGVLHPVLPLAFVLDDDTAVFALEAGELSQIGAAPRYARFAVESVVTVGGESYALSDEGLAISRGALRVARASERPEGVGAQEKWILVDLSEQTLVAYEGDAPVLATLVSSGKPGHETPTGHYRIRHKHVSTTMRGRDPVDGPYEVEEVPWTQYYAGNHALHGAYWHDELGRVRSHGCTNLAPADARWLLHWTDPPLPDGWHSIRSLAPDDGTRVYITE